LSRYEEKIILFTFYAVSNGVDIAQKSNILQWHTVYFYQVAIYRFFFLIIALRKMYQVYRVPSEKHFFSLHDKHAIV